MALRICSYKLKLEAKQNLVLPADAEIISVINRYNDAYIYAIVDTEVKNPEIYSILCYSTGSEISSEERKAYTFLGSISTVGGDFVYHIFYKRG